MLLVVGDNSPAVEAVVRIRELFHDISPTSHIANLRHPQCSHLAQNWSQKVALCFKLFSSPAAIETCQPPVRELRVQRL